MKTLKVIALVGTYVAAGGLAFAGSTANVYQDGSSQYAQVYQTGGDNDVQLSQTTQRFNPTPILTGNGAYIEQYGTNTITGGAFDATTASEQAGNNWASVYQSGANYLEFFQYSQVGDFQNSLSVNQTGENTALMLTYGDGNSVAIGQDGTYNYAVAVQASWDYSTGLPLPANFNNASIGQYGYSNSAYVNQEGEGNMGSVLQQGDYNSAGIYLFSTASLASIEQFGLSNYAYASIYGVGNSDGLISQTGDYNTAGIYVSGDNNVFGALIQVGSSNSDYIEIYGNGNSADISAINGNYNVAGIYQYGDANTADITQTGGDFNWASIDQYNSGNTASITQNGFGNEAFISQGY